MSISKRWLVVWISCIVACGGDPEPGDGGPPDVTTRDSAQMDTPFMDARTDGARDAGTDGGIADSGMADAELDVGEDATLADAGPPISCEAARRLSSSTHGRRDTVVNPPRNEMSDSCVDAVAPSGINGVLYYALDVAAGEGVEIFAWRSFVAEVGCDGSCGDRLESGTGSQDRRYLNRGDSMETITVAIGGDATAPAPPTAGIRFNSVEEYVSCESALDATAPSTLRELNTLGASTITVDCPGAFALDGADTNAMYVRLMVPPGATLRAEAESRAGETPAGTFTPPSVFVTRSCPDSTTLTCIGEPPRFGVTSYTNASSEPESVVLVGLPRGVPRFDLILTLE